MKKISIESIKSAAKIALAIVAFVCIHGWMLERDIAADQIDHQIATQSSGDGR